MLTDEFRAGVEKLLGIGRQRRTAIMCAEARVEDCHRSLVSDFLVGNGIAVQHILATGELKPHTLASTAKVEDGKVTYPEQLPLFDGE